MGFSIENSTELLRVTPATLRTLLGELSEAWTSSSNDTTDWQAYDIIGHLIHAENTDWIPRARIILAQGDDRTFAPFDRLAQFEDSKGKSLLQLLDEFEQRRKESLDTLRSWNLSDQQLALAGLHPELGDVTLRQLLATWVVHDLTHVRQIATAMAKRYSPDVGPWKEYLSILK